MKRHLILFAFLFIVIGCNSKEKRLIHLIESSSELIVPKNYEVFENSIVKKDNRSLEILKLHFDETTFRELVKQVEQLHKKDPYSWHSSKDIYSFHGGKIDENYVIYIFVNSQSLVLDYSKEVSE